jgi:hypothetical protein
MRTLITAAALLAVSPSAFAGGIQAQCGNQAGRGFAANQGPINPKDAGWYDDTLTGETVIRIDMQNGAAQIRYKDASQTWHDASDDGGKVSVVSVEGDPPSILLVAVYENAVETYTITEVTSGSAKLIATNSKVGTLITNSRLMTASCKMSAY